MNTRISFIASHVNGQTIMHTVRRGQTVAEAVAQFYSAFRPPLSFLVAEIYKSSRPF